MLPFLMLEAMIFELMHWQKKVQLLDLRLTKTLPKAKNTELNLWVSSGNSKDYLISKVESLMVQLKECWKDSLLAWMALELGSLWN